MTKPTLCFYTTAYPYGNAETFIENELNIIAPHFEKIYLFHKTKTTIQRVTPNNVELIYIEPPTSSSNRKTTLKNIFLLTYFIIHEYFFSRQKQLFRKNIRYNVSHFINCLYYANQITQKLSSEVLNNGVFYSYWFYDWNLSLSILNYKKEIKKNYTRTHGFDLYENNGKENYLPLRKFCLEHTNKIFTISKKGERYLKSLYPKYSTKIMLAYLGTKDYGSNPLPNNTQPFHIVSCSNINFVKRLHLIIDTLNHINFKIKWTHIGDGPLSSEIKELSQKLPTHIEVVFMGRLTQNEIFNFYKTSYIDVFINTSVSEGLPVSIMEAISFGIPIIATDVGGTNEIINDTTGWLIPADFSTKTISDLIHNIKHETEKSKNREEIKKYWELNFKGEENYDIFVKQNLNTDKNRWMNES